MKKIVFIFFTVITSLIYSSPILRPGGNADGHFEGKIEIYGTQLGIKLDFKTDADSIRGTIDIPEQNASGLKLIHIKSTVTKLSFELPAGPGLAMFDGKWIGTDSVYGSFTQAGMSGTFGVKKGEKKEEIQKTDVNPYLIPDAPFRQEEVTFTNGENTFAGTLTIPDKPGKHPAVVMITGSGPQDRDEQIMGFKPFRIIADHLTRNGIAVLRYDDRGVGGTTGKSINESTTDDFSGDVIEAVKYLQTREDINPQQVGLCGHSEGGIIAPLAASKDKDIAFIVLVAGTGVKGIEILKEQSKLIMKANQGTDEEIDGYMKMFDEVYEASKTGKGWDDLKEMYKKSMEENYDRMTDKEKKSIPEKDVYVNNMAEQTLKQFKSKWMTYFMAYNPWYALSKVSCPVLMYFGAKDMQVPPKQNQGPMKDAMEKAGNKDYTIKIFPDANHLFQAAKTGNPSEYGTLPKEFVPGFLDTMSEWIAARVTIVK